MRYLPILVFLVLSTLTSPGQTKRDVTVGLRGANEQYPHTLDSIIVRTWPEGKIEMVLSNYEVPDTVVRLQLPTGYFSIAVKARQYTFPDCGVIAVCSGCDNKINLRYFHEKDKAWLLLTCVDIYYKGGENKLRTDFQSVLTVKEKRQLRKAGNSRWWHL